MGEIDTFSWNKIVRESKKAGFREGAADGREANFQNSFDRGYAEGFKNGFALGQLKSTNIENPLLNNTRSGNCVMCKDATLQGKRLDDVKKSQEESTQILIKKLNCSQTNII